MTVTHGMKKRYLRYWGHFEFVRAYCDPLEQMNEPLPVLREEFLTDDSKEPFSTQLTDDLTSKGGEIQEEADRKTPAVSGNDDSCWVSLIIASGTVCLRPK